MLLLGLKFDWPVLHLLTSDLTQLQFRTEHVSREAILSDSIAAHLIFNRLLAPQSTYIEKCIYCHEDLASMGKDVVLQRIPGHCGVLGSEKADSPSKEEQSHRPFLHLLTVGSNSTAIPEGHVPKILMDLSKRHVHLIFSNPLARSVYLSKVHILSPRHTSMEQGCDAWDPRQRYECWVVKKRTLASKGTMHYAPNFCRNELTAQRCEA
ncbi:hypothetical protein TNIN_141841 [Trichonephila inaurata madagascariensis]|uniref:RNase H type-1 domain-containing protein n=1 Tax=Trichonephila inaurata madagascariensis TaxID=2747483 RepID=A0A8X6XMW2_9ARAC|nr:hypothetical protein TNIN_141841 [Trichonephila inaurata madagascariensis]